MYGHKGLLRWTGIGKTYRYNDDVVLRFHRVELGERPASAGLFVVSGKWGYGPDWPYRTGLSVSPGGRWSTPGSDRTPAATGRETTSLVAAPFHTDTRINQPARITTTDTHAAATADKHPKHHVQLL